MVPAERNEVVKPSELLAAIELRALRHLPAGADEARGERFFRDNHNTLILLIARLMPYAELAARPSPLDLFMAAYATALTESIARSPDDYAYGPDQIPAVVEKMRRAFANDEYAMEGSKSIPAACRAVGIKCTRAAIYEFINGKPREAKARPRSASASAPVPADLGTDLDRFLANLRGIAAQRARAALQKPVNWTGHIVPLHVQLEERVREGWTAGEHFVSPDGKFFARRDVGELGMRYAQWLATGRDPGPRPPAKTVTVTTGVAAGNYERGLTEDERQRTAVMHGRGLGADDTYKTWSDRVSMAKAIRKDEERGPRSEWRPLIHLAPSEGY